MYEVELELAKAQLSLLKRTFNAFKEGKENVYEVHRLCSTDNLIRIIGSVDRDIDYVDITVCRICDGLDKYKEAYYRIHVDGLNRVREQFNSIRKKFDRIDIEVARYRVDDYGYIDNSESDAEMGA